MSFRFIVIVVLLLCKNSVFSQSNEKKDSLHAKDSDVLVLQKKTTAKTTLFLQLAGSSFIYSIGVDRLILCTDEFQVSFSCGYEILPIYGLQHFIVPQSHFLLGNSNHYVAAGVGLLIPLQLPDNFVYSFSLGYRYQRQTGGIFLQPAVSLLVNSNSNSFFAVLPGLSIGYTFKSR